jgi:small subunit ribosomal protein S16
MAVKLRLKRMGRRHTACYRLTAMDARRPRDGRVLEELGTYAPDHPDAAKQFQVNVDRVRHWLSVGATPSDTVGQLLAKQGISLR